MAASFPYHRLKGRSVLITGGLGFIGSSLAHRCVRLGAEVTLLDACLEPYGWNPFNIREIERDVRFIRGDVRDRDLVTPLVGQADIVFHMAAQVGREISMSDPRLDAEINCTGTLNVLEAARKSGQPPRVVFAGSRGQAGEPESMPVDETHPDRPTDIYGINKLAGEKYLLLYHHVYALPVVSLRLNNVYGPRCQMHAGFYGILNWFMANAMQEKPITVYGDGSQTRDYVYIDDVVDAFVRAAVSEQTDGEVFYVGSGVETVFIEMVREVVRAVGKGEIVHIPFPGSREKIDIRRFVVSTAKLEAATGWKAEHDLRIGIEKTAEYYKKYLWRYLNREVSGKG
ncbi:MAG TPA: NAD-dependent epimerase/dehydratase family protein [bacterium]|nr:NAD-dependent epimerase/dehydratase family protein [bacterium]